MTDLKTLKDFYHSMDPVFDENDNSLTIENLKKDAINDIKEFRKAICEYKDCNMEEIIGGDQTAKRTDAVIRYIKWKHNLTEDDLK